MEVTGYVIDYKGDMRKGKKVTPGFGPESRRQEGEKLGGRLVVWTGNGF